MLGGTSGVPDKAARLLLVGFMGAGKSTVGKLLADRMGWNFVDLDAEIERAAGCTVAELFAAEGEAGFRQRELAVTQALENQERIVVATGGGWMANPYLAGAAVDGTTVWLRVSPEETLRRAGAEPALRPLLGASVEQVSALLAARAARYAQADLTIETDGRTPSEIADEIIAASRILRD